MYFHRIAHPANFRFAESAPPGASLLQIGDESAHVELKDLGCDVYRLRIAHSRFGPHGSHAELTPPNGGSSEFQAAFDADATLQLRARDGATLLLQGVPRATFGWCGTAWMLQFRHTPEMQFYGLGEHSKHLEKSGQRIKFWNTDLFGDFPKCEADNGFANPMYVAIPWLIVKQENRYVGILVNNPGAVFMDLASNFIWSDKNAEDRARSSFFVGAPSGAPEVFLIAGPSLAQLTRKLQQLVGPAPRPPVWALGHHQCRWGYAGADDLLELDAKFRQHEIPCDGLWLDIDYMERYKVFTWAAEHWGDEKRIQDALTALAKRGRRVVPILDPGVKAERGYAIREEGEKAGIFCLNPEGKPFVGFVWPGQTYFPDFSLAEARSWWAKHVQQLAELGVAGAWIDMNDPSVGAVELDDMLWQRGKMPHAYYHNQYALGMAQATRDGFLQARPDERPFVISRSAFISSSRYTAVWLGDNVSNWHHLRMSIPLALGLSLSGVAFNGADVCGFKEDTNPELAVAWYKAAFLFPFFRNHSDTGTRRQEPYALGDRALSPIRHYIQLRYKLLPYLYQLFTAHERSGDAILRPLFYDFPDNPRGALGRIQDEFLVGPEILQAPIVKEGADHRKVLLPGGTAWFEAQTGRWLDGGGQVGARCRRDESPLFVREGALLPMQEGVRRTNRNDFARLELHCFFRRDTGQPAELVYEFDDGLTFGYRKGETTRVHFRAEVAQGVLTVRVLSSEIHYKPLSLRIVIYDRFEAVRWIHGETAKKLPLTPFAWRFTGPTLKLRASTWLRIGKPS